MRTQASLAPVSLITTYVPSTASLQMSTCRLLRFQGSLETKIVFQSKKPQADPWYNLQKGGRLWGKPPFTIRGSHITPCFLNPRRKTAQWPKETNTDFLSPYHGTKIKRMVTGVSMQEQN